MTMMVGVDRIVRGARAALVLAFVAFGAATGCLGRTSVDEYAPTPGFSFDAGLGGSGAVASGGGAAGLGGGASGSGGFEAGGSPATGGASFSGGFFGSGGVPGTGGLGAGGFAGTGGITEAGGVPSTGGVIGAGGVPGSGGQLGTGGAPGCPSACAGCCDASGSCLPGTDTNGCGLGGVRCLDCGSSGFACDQGSCRGAPPPCAPGNCAGCCDALGRCRVGNQSDACGSAGATCADCGAQGLACAPAVLDGSEACTGKAPECSAATCGGCCDASGSCRTGTSDAACGANGHSCDDCATSGRKCNQPGSYCAFIPSCSALTCPDGCCDASGVCQNGRTDADCGTSGQACSNCTTSGQHCSASGFCYNGIHCGPDNCGGCCSTNGSCLAGTGSRNCGLYGAACDNCVARGETCQGGACGAVGATCPAPYPGCTPGLLTSPPTPSRSCTPSDLTAVASACPGLTSNAGCSSAVVSLSRSNPGCFDCLQQFLYDGAAVKCLAPFLTPSCNQALSCATECVNASCTQCASTDKQGCQDAAFQSGGACAAYINGYFCAQAAFAGPAAFCDIKTIGSVGGFLQGVGAYYCSP